MILVAVLVQVGHVYLSAAIKPGHAVHPGVLLRKCGVLSLLPIGGICENERMVYEADGRVAAYDANDEVLWEAEGGTCDDGEEDCKEEMRFNDDLSLVIGGKTISHVKTYKDSALSPWPFAQSPKVRMVPK
jgi:hypothetical protein